MKAAQGMGKPFIISMVAAAILILAAKATASASSQMPGNEALHAKDGKPATFWKAARTCLNDKTLFGCP